METFKSKTIHYYSNGHHNPLASHSPERCWQLHPEKHPDRYQRDAKTNYNFAQALLTVGKTLTEGDVLNVVLDTGASDHMFNNRSFFLSLDKIRDSTISTGCDSSSLTAIGKGTAKLIDRNGVCWKLKNLLYVPKLNTNLVALSQLASQVTIKSTGIPPIKRQLKFESIVWEGIILGYENQASAYRILRLQDKRVVISRHVKFNETYFPNLLPPLKSENSLNPIPPIPLSSLRPHSESNDIVDKSDSCSEWEDEFHDTVEEMPQRRIRSIGPRHPTLITGDVSEANILPYQRRAHQTVETSKVPNNYQKAINSRDGNRWKEAISKELNNMEKLEVWTIRDKTPKDHPIPCTWVFKVKEDDQKRVIEHKARLCAQGFHKIQGLDYSQTFSPTGQISLLQALISNAAFNNLQFHQMDVKSVFLNAPLNESICLAVPEGIDIPKTKVLHLKKETCGLKQAPLAWYNHLAKWLISVGFACSLSDSCVFYRGGSQLIWIYVHVDNLAIFGPNIKAFKEEIQGKFNMKDLGKANLLLGIKILHNEAGFSLLQEHYIKNIAKHYNITSLTPVNTPLKPGLQLTKATKGEIETFQKLGLNYRSIIGALNYINTNTRPEISFAISHLSQFLERPSLKHWEASLQVLRYLYHTKEKTLSYHNKGKCNIISYADADWGNSLIDQRSMGGYTLFLNHHLISWRTKKQQNISHSTTKVEYKSLSDASKEILWFQQLLQEINLEVPGNIPTLYNDNKGAIDLAHSNMYSLNLPPHDSRASYLFIMANNTETAHNQPLPILTENNFPEWRRQTIGLLWKKKLFVHCIEETIPSLSSETRPPAADNKIIDANIETCNIITNSLDLCTFAEIVVGDEEMENTYLLWSKITNCFASSTFNSQVRIWSIFSKITYNGNLRSFISELRQSLNKIKTVGIEVGIKTLVFAILTKFPNDFNSLIEKVTLNTEIQGSPDAILNLLNDAALKEEELKSSIESNKDGKMALNRETFKSKTIHYCSNRCHNPLVNHSPEKCWQLHPERCPDRYQRDAKMNYTFARALLTVDKTLTEGDVMNVVLDTGASDHMFNDRSFFLSLDKIRDSTISTGCDSSSLTAIRKGTAKLIDRNGVCWTLKNLLYVPKLNTNLVALSQLASQVTIKSTGKNMNVSLNDATTPSFQCPSKMKVLETKVKLGIKCLSTRNHLWHQRLGHPNKKAAKTLIPTYKAAGEVCDECFKGKLTGIPFSHSFQSTSHALEVVHRDLCGPMHTQSLSGARYFLILIDQFTGYTTTKFLKRKEETLAAFKEYKTWAENFHQRKIVKIVSDRGGEFVNNCFKTYATTEGFEHSISSPYTLEHNGIAERGNRLVLEKARCLMQQTKLTDQFWAEATSTATFLLNIAPKRDGISPYKNGSTESHQC
ncbi:hypothetical protein O181_012839 [Austropuccinia psidii MF-1]|uniref:Integrase catalytic domain-containing protein n=1 Tax=Austropuccinia psidii MF-1 TaxID=1389203 RepID=A0A9Q3GN91_9BASI|nr:hypothetical protein [Austropuccinia psidii MF-1]